MPVDKTNYAKVTTDPILTALQAFGQALVDCKILDGIDFDDQEPTCPVLLFLIATPDFGLTIHRASETGPEHAYDIVVERILPELIDGNIVRKMVHFSEDLPAICRFLFEDIKVIKGEIKAEET